ncbi:MAG TPA: MaoC family dehydratase [Nocardioidaceae bacterium]|nr:MaoC family dehydratase [Nocardioidaceae bacterium]
MIAEGPYFDELSVGQRFDDAPAVTLTSGMAAMHQAIVGDRLAVPLLGVVAHPALVWNLAIGQSTLATHHVKANLFYRGLAFRRVPVIGDTLSTVTEVVGLRENVRKEGRAPTGLAALRITTVDQEGRSVLDFWRCAMLPLRSDEPTGHDDDLSQLGEAPTEESLRAVASTWELPDLKPTSLEEGDVIEVGGGDVVSSAPELARLTLNIAKVHHDAAGGQRLVYGGHTIALALAQASRAIPQLVTVVGWEGCDHTGPVHEGDTLHSRLEVGRIRPLDTGARLVDLRSIVHAHPDRAVLDWRFTAVVL